MRRPSERRRTCRSAAQSKPATVTARRRLRPLISIPSGRRSISTILTSCSGRRLTTRIDALVGKAGPLPPRPPGHTPKLTGLDRVPKIEGSTRQARVLTMRNAPLQERRNRQILADLVRTYIETGEPVSSRAISKRYEQTLSPATIRNVMADLEDGGYLYQPHTSAGRVPTAAAYRFFAQEIASQATLSVEDRDWIRGQMSSAKTTEEITERAGHVLAEVSNGLGIIVAPPIRRTVLE